MIKTRIVETKCHIKMIMRNEDDDEEGRVKLRRL